jgi:3-dehydroquinate dehydratase II
MTDLLRTIRTGDRRWRIGLLNGPNMPNLGRREQARFGSVRSLRELEDRVGQLAEALGVELSQTFASNHEGEILDWIHSQTDSLDGLLVNPAEHETASPSVSSIFGTGADATLEYYFRASVPAFRGRERVAAQDGCHSSESLPAGEARGAPAGFG